MTDRLEAPILAATVSLLERCGYTVLRLQSGKVKVRGGWMQLCPVGTPDLLVLVKGGVVWLETKRPVGGRVGAAQVVYHAALRRLGHRVELVTSAADAVRLVVAANGSP